MPLTGVSERALPAERAAMLHNLLKVQPLDDGIGDGLCQNESCAISSLVAQANFIFPHWDGCGYIHHPDAKGEMMR